MTPNPILADADEAAWSRAPLPLKVSTRNALVTFRPPGQLHWPRSCASPDPASAPTRPESVRPMNDPDINTLMLAAAERQLAVAALQKKYQSSESVPTEQLVLDMRELLSTERVVLDAIITLFVKLGHGGAAPLPRDPAPPSAPPPTAVPVEA